MCTPPSARRHPSTPPALQPPRQPWHCRHLLRLHSAGECGADEVPSSRSDDRLLVQQARVVGLVREPVHDRCTEDLHAEVGVRFGRSNHQAEIEEREPSGGVGTELRLRQRRSVAEVVSVRVGRYGVVRVRQSREPDIGSADRWGRCADVPVWNTNHRPEPIAGGVAPARRWHNTNGVQLQPERLGDGSGDEWANSPPILGLARRGAFWLQLPRTQLEVRCRKSI